MGEMVVAWVRQPAANASLVVVNNELLDDVVTLVRNSGCQPFSRIFGTGVAGINFLDIAFSGLF